MSLSTLPTPETALKSTATYARDLGERVVFTFLGGFASVALAAGPAGMFHASVWAQAGTAGMAAAVSLVKGIAARWRGATNSASLAEGV